MKRKILFVVVALALAAALGGCSLLGIGQTSEVQSAPTIITNGTTAGNIQNYGYGVQYGTDLIFRYFGEDVYPRGSIVRSSPQSGENSLVLEDGGLYMSIVADYLYYCTPQGVYKTALDVPEPILVLSKDVSLLQIMGGNMYYIENGAIDSATLDGKERDFARIENAKALIVYEQTLYYIGTNDGFIYSADTNGTAAALFYETSVSMFQVMDNVVYYIDSVTGYIHSMPMDTMQAQIIVEYACYGFNINHRNIYYTRYINGIGTCCSALPDGSDEEILSDFGDSAWHLACMWDDGAILVRIEDLLDS